MGGQTLFQGLGPVKQGQQYLIVNPALHTRIQVVSERQEEDREGGIRREVLARQPSYCKILNDLEEAQSSKIEEEDREMHRHEEEEVGEDLVMKSDTIEAAEGPPMVPTCNTYMVYLYYNYRPRLYLSMDRSTK